jgi:pSer/pThr/pTyr-binding forkhead associated (FHA) protein
LLDGSVSAQHALLVYRHGCWWLEDLNSTNGTTLNGRPIDAASPLRESDVIGLGQISFKLEHT